MYTWKVNVSIEKDHCIFIMGICIPGKSLFILKRTTASFAVANPWVINDFPVFFQSCLGQHMSFGSWFVDHYQVLNPTGGGLLLHSINHTWQSYRSLVGINTLRLRQNGRHFADDIFKCIFLNENVWISLKISLKFVPMGPINNIPALVQIMA